MAKPYTAPPVPLTVDLVKEGSKVVIDWKDGGRTVFSAFDLRRLSAPAQVACTNSRATVSCVRKT